MEKHLNPVLAKGLIEQDVLHTLTVLGVADGHHTADTPRRVAKMVVDEQCSSLFCTPEEAIFGGKPGGTFEATSREMIIVREIPFYSLCAHHLVPFFGMAHIGYVPGTKLLGLSKFARIVDYFARKPQIQEVLTSEIVDYIRNLIEPAGVICITEARHLCMEARGVKKPGTVTTTSAIRGDFDKSEFLTLLRTSRLSV